MPLRSKLFRGDPSLEACLVQDSAHLTPGAAGDHVGKIQKALLLLENATIRSEDFLGKRYGPSTADAVLAFKTKRRIINFAYQNRPDNIVGKMTIAILDQELSVAESLGAGRPTCIDEAGGGGGGAILSQRSSSFAVSPARSLTSAQALTPVRSSITNQIVPKTLSIKWMRTTASDATRNASLFAALLGRAGQLVAQFSMLISNNADALALTIPYPHIVQVDHTDALILRKAAKKVLPDEPKVLHVIVCPFPSGDPAFGFTSGQGIDPFQVGFPNYILLDVNKARGDKGTLMHEMIHAATNLPESSHDTDKTSLFSIDLNRTVLKQEHALAINQSFFAS